MLPHLVIDPFLITTPPDYAPEEQKRWLKALLSWIQEVQAMPEEPWRHILDCTTKLWELGLYPDFKKLRRMFGALGIDESAELLARRLNDFFNDEGRDIRRQLLTRDAIGNPTTNIEPALLIERIPNEIQDIFLTGLLCIACDIQRQQPHLLVSYALDNTKSVRVQTDHAILQVQDSATSDCSSLSVSIPLLLCPEDLCDLLGPDEIAQLGPAAFVQHIRLRAQRRKSTVDPMEILIGNEFWNSLQDSTLLYDVSGMNKLLRVATHIVLAEDKDIKVRLKHFRTSAAGAAPQKVRPSDKAEGWRLHLSEHGIGWRLNYWRIPEQNGCPAKIELALVQRKQDTERLPE